MSPAASFPRVAPFFIAAALMSAGAAGAAIDGRPVYDRACAGCHNIGVAAAPRLGDAADWAPRLRHGLDALYRSALEGTAKGMPRKGGIPELTDQEVKAAVDYMVSSLPDKVVAVATASPARKALPASEAAPPQRPLAPANAFNRLMKPPGARNPPPAEDGIHDPDNDGTLALQHPLQAYTGLPKSNAGNRINWVKAVGEKMISPRWDRLDPAAEAVVMDLNIVREVKGTMPDVVYPHQAHTEILDCSNCHPALFEPQKGANKLSMAAIMQGEQCGVCHGKVAFPISECRLCHSQKKASTSPPSPDTP